MAIMAEAEAWHQRVADVFSLVVEHSADANSPQTLCSLLQVSTLVRRAMQQTRGKCRIHHADLGPNGQPYPLRVLRWSKWLVKYPGLVCDVTLNLDGIECAPILAGTLGTALTLCTTGQVTAGGTTLIHHWPGLPLKLDSFCGDSAFLQPALLEGLSGAGVEELALDCYPQQMTPAACDALARCTSVTDLILDCDHADEPLPRGVASATQHMSRLQTLDTALDAAAVHLLSPSINHLSLGLYPGSEDPSAPADISHLTRLETFKCTPRKCGEALLCKLPPNLHNLEIFGPGPMHISGHRDIKDVQLHPGLAADMAVLQQLADLPRSWSLRVELDPEDLVSERVQELDQGAGDDGQQQQQHFDRLEQQYMQAAVQLGRCSKLDSLTFRTGALARPIPWCKEVAKLTQLVTLELRLTSPPAGDVLHLTALQSLVYLDVRISPVGFSSQEATALLTPLTRLVHLKLRCTGFKSLQELSVVSTLTRLSLLQLTDWPKGATMADADLQLLQPLKRLARLYLPLAQQCSKEAQERFLDSKPRLNHMFWWYLGETTV